MSGWDEFPGKFIAFNHGENFKSSNTTTVNFLSENVLNQANPSSFLVVFSFSKFVPTQ
jgi:hypothetical protein